MLQLLAPLLAGGKAKLAIIIAVMLIGSVGGGYLYVIKLQRDIASLKYTNQSLKMDSTNYKIAWGSEKRVTEKTIEQFELMKRENDELQEANERAEKYQKQLIDILTEHDLEYLAYKKPGLIEKRINDATAKVFDDLESLSITE